MKRELYPLLPTLGLAVQCGQRLNRGVALRLRLEGDLEVMDRAVEIF